MLRAIPLLAIVVVIWNVLAFATAVSLTEPAWSLTMASGAVMTMSTGELLAGLALLLLYLEILKATRTSTASIIDHMLSMALFVIALLELILVPEMGSGSFALIVLITLIDVVAGFTVTISTARRDIGLGDQIG